MTRTIGTRMSLCLMVVVGLVACKKQQQSGDEPHKPSTSADDGQKHGDSTSIIVLDPRSDGGLHTTDQECGTWSNSLEPQSDGASVLFRFPDMDRKCGDCSIFGATVVLAPGTIHFHATLNSSDTGDKWIQFMEFYPATGSTNVFRIPNADYVWNGQDIWHKDQPQAFDFTNGSSALMQVPQDISGVTRIVLHARC
jgi:hypothetical protein